MRKLIINADDLGMSDYVNSQIEKCIKLGVITSSTLMANAPAFDGGVMVAKKYPKISIGVHLNIIEFAPLTNKEVFKKKGMLNEDGYFIDGAAFVVSYDEDLKRAIYEEWDAQITRVEKSGLYPTHCDSHQHTHTIDDLQEVLCKVLDKHHIRRVRRKYIPSIRLMLRERRRQSMIHIEKSNAVQPKKRNVIYRRFHLFVVKYNNCKWNKEMSKNYSLTNAFFSFDNFYTDRNLLCFGGKSSTVELMCHPGNVLFQSETNSLMNDLSWMSDNFNLISYNQL